MLLPPMTAALPIHSALRRGVIETSDGHANVTGLRLLASIVNHGFRGSDHVLHPPPSTLASTVVGTKGDELICAYVPGADLLAPSHAPMIGPRPYEDARRG